MNKKFAWFVIDFISVQLVFNKWYPFSTQFAPSPFAKNIPKEVEQALKKNQMILINICICLDNNANSLFVNWGVKGWPIPTLKQLFSMAVTFTFKNKFKKGIISWENYQANKLSSCCLIFHFSLKWLKSSEFTCFLSGVFVDSSLGCSPISSPLIFLLRLNRN